MNAVTWAVFPGQEIVQSTIIEEVSFLAWKVSLVLFRDLYKRGLEYSLIIYLRAYVQYNRKKHLRFGPNGPGCSLCDQPHEPCWNASARNLGWYLSFIMITRIPRDFGSFYRRNPYVHVAPWHCALKSGVVGIRWCVLDIEPICISISSCRKKCHVPSWLPRERAMDNGCSTRGMRAHYDER